MKLPERLRKLAHNGQLNLFHVWPDYEENPGSLLLEAAEEIERLQHENAELRDYIRQLRQFDAAVDACDECIQQIPCAEHSVRVIELSKISRELAQ